MTSKAIVVVEKGVAAIKDVPTPKLRDDYVLVKVKAVGVNPTDWKHIYRDTPAGTRVGCDYSGIVEEVGSAVTKEFKKGDRIAGVVHGSESTNHEYGAFGEYLIAKGDVQIKIPDAVNDIDAATLGISVATVGQGLYKTLGLPLPQNDAPKSDEYILIYGGSTATGIYGVQYAKLSGLKVLATASPHNADYLKSLGVEKVFDYKSPNVGEEIRSYTSNKLKYVWDCTGFGGPIGAAALSSDGGKFASIIPIKKEDIEAINPKVDGPHVTLMYSIFGEEFTKGGNVTPVKPDEYEFAKKFWEISRGLLADKKLVAPRTFVNRTGSGLEGVMGGLDELRLDKVSGGKLVYTIGDWYKQ